MYNVDKLEKYKTSYELCQKFLKELNLPKQKANSKCNMESKVTKTDKK